MEVIAVPFEFSLPHRVVWAHPNLDVEGSASDDTLILPLDALPRPNTGPAPVPPRGERARTKASNSSGGKPILCRRSVAALAVTALGLVIAGLVVLKPPSLPAKPERDRPAPPEAEPPEPACRFHGTNVAFVGTPAEAARRARKDDKLVFLLHLSGHFEDPGFT
jgi:hypothetical protein